jgi:16S rRNA (guanine(966)-N(2))-methyltransferase RsmD
MLASLGGLDAARVLDLFAGSGSLGIEALSRGAAAAIFVDHDPSAIEILRANLAGLGLGPPVARVRGGDALDALRAAGVAGDAFDLVFLDPPYAGAAELGGVLDVELEQVLADGGLVVCESDRRRPLELDLPVERERRYGDTLIRIYRRGDRSR